MGWLDFDIDFGCLDRTTMYLSDVETISFDGEGLKALP